jgi:LPS-assembly lipoprotein
MTTKMAGGFEWFRRMRLGGVLLAVALTLSACGFHLRGESANYRLPFPTIYVGLPVSSPLAVDLKRHIRSNGGTEVVNTAAEADGIIQVDVDPEKTKTKTILSLNSNGRVRQYQLNYHIVFRVLDKQGKELLGSTSITLTRPIDFNETQLLAKEQEELLLYKDMQTDLVSQMMRRIAAVKTDKVSLPPPGAAPVDPATAPAQPIAPPQPIN